MHERAARILALFTLLLAAIRLCIPGAADPVIEPNAARFLDAESLFAIGGKIPFRTADQFELELIPGVSSVLSLLLIEKRFRILDAAARNECPFAAVRGVGSKKREQLEKFLSLN